MSKKSIIITAGGVGKRMGATIPKQFLLLGGRPIMMHTIERFYSYDPGIEIIVVLPEGQQSHWKELCSTHLFEVQHLVVTGGKERFHSVQNGLKKATGNLVGVHDAVRPLVSIQVIENCFQKAAEKGAAIPVVSVKESIRKKEGNSSVSLDRSAYLLVQTPQCFRFNVLNKAYDNDYRSTFTDDASVVEFNGDCIALVDGNEENIKITTPADLQWAELLLKNG